MLEVECPAVTPEIVLKASGHVERFTDFMVGGSGADATGRVAGAWAAVHRRSKMHTAPAAPL